MPRFTIVPSDRARKPVELVAADASAALHLTERMKFMQADVLRNQAYAFTLKLNEGGFWSIFMREQRSAKPEQPLQAC